MDKIEKISLKSFKDIEIDYDKGKIGDEEAFAKAIYIITLKLNEVIDRLNKE